MKLSDRLKEAAKHFDDVILTRLGYVHPEYDQRKAICDTCDSNVTEPLSADEALVKLMGLEDRMCNECGCGIRKLCASKKKRCDLKKW